MQRRSTLALFLTAATALAAHAQDKPRWQGPAPHIAEKVRALGPVINPPATQKIYREQLDAQPKDGVRRANDISYGADERHVLDLYVPEPRPSEPMPVVIQVHGGGFIRGSHKDRENWGYLLARNGVVAVVATHRLAPKHKWPAGTEDLVAVVKWAKANASEHGGDARRIIMIGESAGATHVASAALQKRFHPSEGLGIAGIVLMSGVYNPELSLIARRQFGIETPDPRHDAYYGTDRAKLREMSIVGNLDAPRIPTLITWAELDPVHQQVQSAELFAALCKRDGACPEVHWFADHSHISQVYSPNTPDTSVSGPILQFLKEPKPSLK